MARSELTGARVIGASADHIRQDLQMKQTLITYVGISALAFAVAGCTGDTGADTAGMTDDDAMSQTTAGASAGQAGTMASGGASADEAPAKQFLMDAMRGDNAEIQAGRLAAEKGSSEAVKDYGNMLAQEHGAHKTQVVQVGQAMSVQSTDEPTRDGEQLMSRLQGLSGAEFDRAFAQGMVQSHRKTIAMYEQQERAGGSEEVVMLVRQSLPVLRKHLEQAERLPQ